MDFEIKKIEEADYRLIVYTSDDASTGYVCVLRDLTDLHAQAVDALDNVPVTPSGMFALLLSSVSKDKPYRLISYASEHSDGFRMTRVDINMLKVALEAFFNGNS